MQTRQKRCFNMPNNNHVSNNMIDITTVQGFWYDGNTPIANLTDGREVVLSEEDAQFILDWSASLANRVE